MAERTVVLVVHIDATLRKLIASVLDAAGFEVIQTGDAEAALQRARELAIDLVVIETDDTISAALVDQLRTACPALKALYIAGGHPRVAAPDSVLHLPLHAGDLVEAAAALAFGRCRCPACVRRSHAANE